MLMFTIMFKSGSSMEIEIEEEELLKLSKHMHDGTLFESSLGPVVRMSEVAGYAPVYDINYMNGDEPVGLPDGNN